MFVSQAALDCASQIAHGKLGLVVLFVNHYTNIRRYELNKQMKTIGLT